MQVLPIFPEPPSTAAGVASTAGKKRILKGKKSSGQPRASKRAAAAAAAAAATHAAAEYEAYFESVKYVVVNLVPNATSEHTAGKGQGGTVKVPKLRNSSIMIKDKLGVYRLHPQAQRQYVLLPYPLGLALYEQFDAQAAFIPGTAYKR
jgi:hypothetical protein